MACVPVITSPCPLRFNAMPSAGMDFCSQCRRRVHNLDGMSDASRQAFFASCSGEVCVAYTVRRPAALASVFGLGVAAAAALGANTALAQQSADVQTTVTVVHTGPTCDPNAKGEALDTLVMMGGTTKAAQWVDETQVSGADQPQIAEIGSAEWLPTPPQAMK